MNDLDMLYDNVFGEEELLESVNFIYEKATKKKNLKEAEAVSQAYTLNVICSILMSTLSEMKKKGIEDKSIPENAKEKISSIRDNVRSMIKKENVNAVKVKMAYKKLDKYYKPIFNVAKKNKIKMGSIAIGGDLAKRNISSTDQIMKMIHDQFVKQQKQSDEAMDKLLDLY